jgi:hypothetical protein
MYPKGGWLILVCAQWSCFKTTARKAASENISLHKKLWCGSHLFEQIQWVIDTRRGVKIILLIHLSHYVGMLKFALCRLLKRVKPNLEWNLLSFSHPTSSIVNYNSKYLYTLPKSFIYIYEGVSKSFRTVRLEWELQMVQLSATRCSCTAILWDSLVSFAAITLCVASQQVFFVVVDFVMTQSGNFWVYPRVCLCVL